jgi:hypothetical protein
MQKMKIKKYGEAFFNEHDKYSSSSSRNPTKIVEWIHKWENIKTPFTIYIDQDIFLYGNQDPNPNKLAWILESRQIVPHVIQEIVNNLDYFKQNYKAIFTSQLELLALGEPFKYTISNAVPWIYPENRKIHPKTKLVSMIASNKAFCQGHRERLEWAEKLKNYVDLWGWGRPNQLNDKEDGLQDYMFSVAIENDVSDAYFTEKLTDCFAMGTVPLYIGSKRVIDEYFDEKGIIWLTSEDDVKNLTPELYYDMMPHIENNFKLACDLPTSEDFITYTYLYDLYKEIYGKEYNYSDWV